jgi:DNA-binding MarR family transcriptional regulator
MEGGLRSRRMRNNDMTLVSEDLLSISPLISRLIRRKLIRTHIPNIALNITPLHFEILRLLEEAGTLHVSEIGERLQIAKAQMTKLIDKLVDLRVVERKNDAEDRRIVNISLTSKAKTVIKENKKNVLKAVQEVISSLPDEDLKNLSVSLHNVRDILLKAQQGSFVVSQSSR